MPGARADDTGVRRQIRDHQPPSRWSVALTSLDIFWPILAVILTGAVVFVAVVAHTSMDNVGAPASKAQPPVPTPSTTSTTSTTIVIVQVSSHPTRAKAEAAAQELADQAFEPQILKSDDYEPLNPGFFVVYVGPFPPTEVGREAAKQVQEQLPGALIREIHLR
jgi:SPOR domain